MSSTTGTINGVSATGFVIDGAWFNFGSSFDRQKPIKGQRVNVTYKEKSPGQPGGWVEDVEILDGGAVQQRASGPGRPGRSPEERREIIRQSVLKSAVEFAGHVMMSSPTQERISSTDVLKIADRWVEWVQKGE
jgi:hypothetical protein